MKFNVSVQSIQAPAGAPVTANYNVQVDAKDIIDALDQAKPALEAIIEQSGLNRSS